MNRLLFVFWDDHKKFEENYKVFVVYDLIALNLKSYNDY